MGFMSVVVKLNGCVSDMVRSPTRVGGEKAHVDAYTTQEVSAPRLTICGLVRSSHGCGMLPIYCGALLVQKQSDGNRFLPVRLFEAWVEDLPISLRSYRGKTHVLSCVDPKQLVPNMTCAQRVVLLRVGKGGRLRVLTCQSRKSPLLTNQPADWVIILLAVVWLHSSWVAFGSV